MSPNSILTLAAVIAVITGVCVVSDALRTPRTPSQPSADADMGYPPIWDDPRRDHASESVSEPLETQAASPLPVSPRRSVSEKPKASWVLIDATITAYTPGAESCWPYDDGKTSTGVDTSIHPWGIAGCPTLLPYGTEVVVPGYVPSRHIPADRPWKVDDTGGAMRQAARRGRIHVDVRFIHLRSALRHGVREAPIWVRIDEMPEDLQRWHLRRAREFTSAPQL